ncbi:MAG: radical SAM family heme chaperone HemW [Actinobacteria bacterium]|nr:radical SAM family heme chaperone HemW [Actinomycetota bacterium]
MPLRDVDRHDAPPPRRDGPSPVAGAADAGVTGIDPPFGVYVHIPFCRRRCDYCAFATWTDRHHLHQAYAAACRREVQAAALPPATSVFFGGGTPSLLPAPLLVSVLDAIERVPGAEVTVECNPETVTAELLDSYAAGGVNRLSLGVQSMVPRVLSSLGRDHDPAVVEPAVERVKAAGFGTWSVDLIHGAAGESLEDWRRTLDQVLALEPPHVSAYALTVEPGTPLARQRDRQPDDDDQADKYLVAEATLTAAGLANYEISNWARPGHECGHNRLYWEGGDYRGIGCAAHSHRDGRRWWNVRTPDRYIAAIEAGASPVAASEVLAPADRRMEALQLALRTRAGVPAGALPPEARAGLDDLVVEDGGLVRLTPTGRLLADEVAVRLR